MNDLSRQFGNIDIYLFDQLLKGRILPQHRVLDAGCGGGRNLIYLLQSDCDVYGVDSAAEAVEANRQQAARLRFEDLSQHFRRERIEDLSFEDDFFDVVLASATLHFAESEEHFQAMLSQLWRVLRPGGLFFARLASSRGFEERIQWLGPRRGIMADGSTRFLIDDDYLEECRKTLGGLPLEPVKTTLVADLRAMTTWVLQKPA